MKSVKGKEFAKLLEKNGWTLVRVSGSHRLFQKVGHRNIVLAVHANEDLKTGMLRSLMRQAGLKESDL